MKIWTFPIQNIDLIYELLLHFSTNENCIKILRIVKILLLRNLFLENFEFINLYVNLYLRIAKYNVNEIRSSKNIDKDYLYNLNCTR